MSVQASQNPAPGGYREMLRVAYPLVLSMGTFTIMQFCDRIFLAHYSSTSIQAALPAGILSFTLICFFHALAGYSGTFVAQYHGAGTLAFAAFVAVDRGHDSARLLADEDQRSRAGRAARGALDQLAPRRQARRGYTRGSVRVTAKGINR